MSMFMTRIDILIISLILKLDPELSFRILMTMRTVV